MKKWRCTVCNYVHEGDTPPDKCPVCGVGSDKFVLIEESTASEPIEEKNWRCTVCNYVHEDDNPPDKCPICGVGPNKFVLIEEPTASEPVKEKKWRCTVCNHVHSGETAPAKCPVCGVGPNKFVLIEEPTASEPVKEKKWRCTVCNHVHNGETAPAKCPVCGVGSDKFVLIEDATASDSVKAKKWRCTVCNYIHKGETPPAKCPICGVGPEKFVLVEEVDDGLTDKKKDDLQTLLFNVSYGLYIISSIKDDKLNGMVSNTFIQVTDTPLKASVCLGKGTLTSEYVRASGVFGASILGKDNHDLIKHFGYQSGRDVDKFKTRNYITGKTGCPGLSETLCFIECEVEQTIDLGTHYLFIGKVVDGDGFKKEEPMTYAYYHATR
ncbi:MAG: flavin reductase [Acetobacterium sp.]|nr:flavin reductase [Acetobacterium sp.]